MISAMYIFVLLSFFLVINLLSLIYMKDVEKLFLDESNYLKDVFLFFLSRFNLLTIYDS